MRPFKIPSLSSFQIYVIVLLSIVPMLYINYFTTGSLSLLTSFPHLTLPSPLASDNHQPLLCIYELVCVGARGVVGFVSLCFSF